MVFLISVMGAACLLKAGESVPHAMIRAQMLTAGILAALAFWSFSRIKVNESLDPQERTARPDRGAILEAIRIVRTDGRYRRYLFSCFLFGFSGLMYVSYIAAFLEKDLGFDYVWGAWIVLHFLPAGAAFLTTGAFGKWFDR